MAIISALIAQGKELAGPRVAWGDVVSPIMERAFYDAVMGECVRPLEGLERRFTCDMVSGTAVYCTPPLDTIEAVYCKWADGTTHELATVHSHDARGGTAYTSPQSGSPLIAIMEGLGSVRLSPTPNYNSTAGLDIRGYGPYTASDYALSDECPLNVQDEVAVVRGIAYYLLELVGDPRQTTLQMLYRQARSQMEINAHTYTAAHRVRGIASSSSSVGGQNPLNW